MKLLTILTALIFITSSCSASKIDGDSLYMEYSAQSRGRFKQMSVTKKGVSVVNKPNGKPVTKAVSEKNWNAILKHLKNVNLENIPNLKAPSTKRFFDGDAIGNFKIISNGKTYETPPFDDGNPPPEIADLVKEIVSISETVD